MTDTAIRVEGLSKSYQIRHSQVRGNYRTLREDLIDLRRYGDQLDPSESANAFNEMKHILAPGDRLYTSASVGNEDITYSNATRVFQSDSLLATLHQLVVAGKCFIAGHSLQDDCEASPMWGTTALLELTKPSSVELSSVFQS